jgi:hypothetical protein
MKTKLTAALIALILLTGCTQFVNTAPPIITGFAGWNELGEYAVEFHATVRGGQEPMSYIWTTGDGGVLHGNPSPTYHYNQDGEYDVTVTVTDALGRQATYGTLVIIDRNRVCWWEGRDLLCDYPASAEDGWFVVPVN